MPNNAVGFLHNFYKTRVLASLEDKGLTSYLCFAKSLQDLGIFLSQYFIPIS